jgi:hypothetical protein
MNLARIAPLPATTALDSGYRNIMAAAEIEHMRSQEAYEARMNAEIQRVSRDLAHHYRRNVFVSSRLPRGTMVIEKLTGERIAVPQRPSRRFLLEDKSWREIAMALDMGYAVLKRDTPQGA